MIAVNKPEILDLSYAELGELVSSLGEPAFRADQILGWVYKKSAVSFAEMTDLPQAFRQKLGQVAAFSGLVPVDEKVSADGMTRKVLIRLADGSTIESVLMTYGEGSRGRVRGTVCVSTQAGCPIGCPFCATGQQRFRRNLTCGEIIAQVLYFSKPSGNDEDRRSVTNVVFMGMGEPLANYEAVTKAIAMLNLDAGFRLGARQMTVSTAGIVPQIFRLAGEAVTVELAVSLHAATNKLRNYLVPVNQAYPLDELLSVCRYYLKRTGRRPTYEYALFQGINDSLNQAKDLARLLKGMNCHVNLIAGNRTGDGKFTPAGPKQVLVFHQTLQERGLSSTIRTAMGEDIDAGCGQLRGRSLATGRMKR
ncbi:MAG: 23S rRNA (adenine(2503)-C(2))-methyltransferase RlmN [Chloroflexota bacterium]